MTFTEEYSISDLIQEDPLYSTLKQRLDGFHPGSDEYLQALLEELPLNSWPNYNQYLTKQASPVGPPSNSKGKGTSSIYRSQLSLKRLITCTDHNLKTSFDHFQLAKRIWPNNHCLGVRIFDSVTNQWSNDYKFQTYKQVDERARQFGSGILSLVNVKKGKDLRDNKFIVTILSHNSPQWVITDLACQCYDLTNSSLYETLGGNTSEYILNITESPVLCFSKNNLYKILTLLPRLKYINTLICLDEDNEHRLNAINDSLLRVSNLTNSFGETISLYSMKHVETIGAMSQIPINPPSPKSIYTICFTSGTTGLPKGVEITQQIIASGIAFALSTFKIPKHKMGKQLYDMCFLPLAHIFERQILSYDLARGIALGFLHKPDPLVLVEDLTILKPDCLALVPRILTKFESGIKTNLSKTAIQKSLAKGVIDAKSAKFTTRSGMDKSIMNFLIYHPMLIDKVREGLGLNNTSFLITGSAPISKDTLLFLRSCLDIGMRQGYGSTESFAGICLSEPYEKDPGSCGAIGITAECRLKDVPEMNYFTSKELKGELQLRGPQIFSTYYKNKDATKEAIDEDGWFSTGDIAYIDGKGRLYIIDRVKNFFKLSHGEYIAPEKIENIYLSSCPFITQIFVFGNSLRSFLIGIVSVDINEIIKILNDLGEERHHHWDITTLLVNLNEDSKLKTKLLTEINKFVCDGLQGFEKLHNIYIGIDLMSVTNDCITPTFKIKRIQSTKYFKPQLDKLYQEGSIIKNGKF